MRLIAEKYGISQTSKVYLYMPARNAVLAYFGCITRGVAAGAVTDRHTQNDYYTRMRAEG
jgi:hypothetical protein